MIKSEPETLRTLWARPGVIRTVSAKYTLDGKVVDIDLTDGVLRLPEGATDVEVVFVKEIAK